MNKFHLSVCSATVMAIFPETVRKNQKKILKKRRLISGHKFRTQVLPNRIIERKVKEEIQGMDSFLLRKYFLKLELWKNLPLLQMLLLF